MFLTPGHQVPWILLIFYYLTSVQLWTLLGSPPFLSAAVPLAPLPPLASAPVHVGLDTHVRLQAAGPGQRGRPSFRGARRMLSGDEGTSMAAGLCQAV